MCNLCVHKSKEEVMKCAHRIDLADQKEEETVKIGPDFAEKFDERKMLEQEMQLAVDREDYEEAARIRDKLNGKS